MGLRWTFLLWALLCIWLSNAKYFLAYLWLVFLMWPFGISTTLPSVALPPVPLQFVGISSQGGLRLIRGHWLQMFLVVWTIALAQLCTDG